MNIKYTRHISERRISVKERRVNLGLYDQLMVELRNEDSSAFINSEHKQCADDDTPEKEPLSNYENETELPP